MKLITEIRVEEVNPMELRCAEKSDYERIRDFYYYLTDALDDSEFTPGWIRDVYPTQEFLIQSIQNHELYFLTDNEEMIACMIVNHSFNDGYKEVEWTVDASDDELMVIHALGVSPTYMRQGIAKYLASEVIEMARRQNLKTIRLDVLKGNIPAERAYSKVGFQCIATIRMFYEDTGWTDYMLYEYIL